MTHKDKIIYVLSPYRHKDPEVVAKRVEECEKYCAYLFNCGFFPICTTSSGHHLVEKFDVTDDFEIWRDNCHTFIVIAAEVHILTQDGWEQSAGLREEIQFCEASGANFTFVNPGSYTHPDYEAEAIWKRSQL